MEFLKIDGDTAKTKKTCLSPRTAVSQSKVCVFYSSFFLCSKQDFLGFFSLRNNVCLAFKHSKESLFEFFSFRPPKWATFARKNFSATKIEFRRSCIARCYILEMQILAGAAWWLRILPDFKNGSVSPSIFGFSGKCHPLWKKLCVKRAHFECYNRLRLTGSRLWTCFRGSPRQILHISSSISYFWILLSINDFLEILYQIL